MNRIDERDFLVVQGYRSIGVQAVAPPYLHYTIIHTHKYYGTNNSSIGRAEATGGSGTYTRTYTRLRPTVPTAVSRLL